MDPSKVCVVIPTSESENDILEANGGHKKVISLQIIFLRNHNFTVHVLSILDQPGLFPKILKFLKEKGESVEQLKNTKRSNFLKNINWITLILLRIPLYLIQEIDYKFVFSINKQINKLCKSYDRVVIINNLGELNPRILSNKNFKILVKHDIQSKLFSYLIDWYIFKKLISIMAQILERMLIKNSDFIITLNDSDKNFFKKFHDNVAVWIPVIFRSSKEIKKTSPEKMIVGFLGSNWDLNIIGANKILEIASKLKNYPNIEFWIVGTVSKTLDKNSVPNNVKLIGWVENLDKCLSKCDIFLNPKIGITSGLEIKALDYLQYNKPIITTSHGATGLPLSNKNSIIEDDLFKWPDHILFLARSPQAIEEMEKKLKEDKTKFQKKMLITIKKILCGGQ